MFQCVLTQGVFTFMYKTPGVRLVRMNYLEMKISTTTCKNK